MRIECIRYPSLPYAIGILREWKPIWKMSQGRYGQLCANSERILQTVAYGEIVGWLRFTCPRVFILFLCILFNFFVVASSLQAGKREDQVNWFDLHGGGCDQVECSMEKLFLISWSSTSHCTRKWQRVSWSTFRVIIWTIILESPWISPWCPPI